MLLRSLLLLGVVAGGCGAGDDDGDSFVIDGVWVSDDDPGHRGRFELDGHIALDDYEGSISGTLRFFASDGSEVAEEAVTGEGSHEYDGNSNRYWSIDFATDDDEISFSTVYYGSPESSSQMIGHFSNTRIGVEAEGMWHNLVADGPAACDVTGAYPTSYTIDDLAWDGARLVAIATPEGGSPGIYEIEVSEAGAMVTSANPGNPPAAPSGIAWDPDGERYWVVSPDQPAEGQFTLASYDSDWASAGALVTGSYSMGDFPSFIAWGDGKVWFASFFGAPFNPGPYMIDPATGEVTAAAGPGFARTLGFDLFAGEWRAASMAAGGVWSAIASYDSGGTPTGTIFAPVVGGAGAVAMTGDGGLWVVAGEHLVHIAE